MAQNNFSSEPPNKSNESVDDNNSNHNNAQAISRGESTDANGSNSKREAAASSINENIKKEDNPFSFKHFLCSDLSAYQNQGARPKVYCDGKPISSISDMDLKNDGIKHTKIVPEFSSALPDFVQDHLVIEQCYLDKENASHNNYNVNNLPDFTPNGSRSGILFNNYSCHIQNSRQTNNSCDIPLDLPMKARDGFPLDLPVLDNQTIGNRSCPNSAEVTITQSLPDFLTDGAVHSQETEDEQLSNNFDLEINRLRQENELYRQQLSEQTRRCEHLQRQVDSARNKETEYTQNLAKVLEEVENRLENNNKSAESTINKLRQEVSNLKDEIVRLQQENKVLRGEQGAASSSFNAVPSNESHSLKLAHELKTSADTAEYSLRQLLSGVDNLRIIAAALENLNRVKEESEKYSDTEDNFGPAL